MTTQADCIIVGGGIAGLQAAIQMGRYGHRTVVVDRGDGRSVLCRNYRNVLGWPDGVSGTELRALGRIHAEKMGVIFIEDDIQGGERTETGTFELHGVREMYTAQTVLLATGVMDRLPALTGLEPCLGETVYVCPDCDGYEIRDRRTVVLGSGDVGAAMAIALSPLTPLLAYVNHERRPVREDHLERMRELGIEFIQEAVVEILQQSGHLRGVRLQGGRVLERERGFVAFGSNEVRSALARRLGAERHENGHILTDPRTKMTSVPNLWAAGDVGVHAEQVTIAMGEGSQAAIWMHKALAAQAGGGRDLVAAVGSGAGKA